MLFRSRNDACGYRPKNEEELWIHQRDPVKNFRTVILENEVVSEETLCEVEAEIEQEIDDAVEYAKNAPLPADEDALQHVFWEG